MRALERVLTGAAVVVALLIGLPASGVASPISVDYDFGVVDLACTSEAAGGCAQDVLPGTASVAGNIFTNVFNGGYRAGGRVDWDFLFDASQFSSISSMTMRVDVVGLYGAYPGNIGPGGQLGNFFAINGAPVFAFVSNTDGRDSYTFTIPVLSAGVNQFSVQAYDPAFSSGGNFEGWGGVDFARLTVVGEAAAPVGPAAVPEPASLMLLGSGLVGMAVRRRRKTA